MNCAQCVGEHDEGGAISRLGLFVGALGGEAPRAHACSAGCVLGHVGS